MKGANKIPSPKTNHFKEVTIKTANYFQNGVLK